MGDVAGERDAKAQQEKRGKDDLANLWLVYHTPTIAKFTTVNACDVVVGQHIGYLDDPSQCRYDPTKDASVLCTSDGGTNTTSLCLTLAEERGQQDLVRPDQRRHGARPGADNGYNIVCSTGR